MTEREYDIHGTLDRLAAASADRDVLVTRAVAPEETIGAAREPVESDYAEATQLDGSSFPRPLVEGIERVRDRLKEYDEVPENGLVAYGGVVDGEDVDVVVDDLPSPVAESTYVHANEFDIEPLESVTRSAPTRGLLVVERGGAAFGLLEEDGVEPIDAMDSDVPGKSSAGGQSAERFERDRERKKREFFDEVAERAARTFVDEGVEEVLLGGTTVTAEAFLEEADLDHRLEDLLVEDPFAVEYASEQGLRELARKAREADGDRAHREPMERLSEFFEALRNDGAAPVAYGREEVDDALSYDAVETALLSTELSGADLSELGDRTAEQGGEVVVIPDDVPEGSRFAEAFGGVAAILRFPIE